MSDNWAPGADAQTRSNRALLLRTIREFFHDAGVMEVATPVLGRSGVTDVHIESLAVHRGKQTWYLQTSPEYLMKRLLAADGQPIYQLGPVFRGGEVGQRHNIEFTMLEWYRPGFTLAQLATEVKSLLLVLAETFNVRVGEIRDVRYGALFESRWDIDPHSASPGALKALAQDLPNEHLATGAGRDDYLDLLFSAGIESSLVTPTFVFNYPASQAALAEVEDDGEGHRVARRFEMIWRGTELANGYQELRDPAELRRRMQENNARRQERGLPPVAPDEKLIAALPTMPPCAGVAVGVDRLLMLLTGKQSLDDVMDFADARL